jgi:RNA polymerase sigma-70 factor (ECF subfamily)
LVLSDREVLAKVADGDEAAFERLYDRFADRVNRYAFTILRDKHLAQEVAQETMTAVWKSAARFAGRSKPSTWIFGIARNQALSLRRKESRTETVAEAGGVAPDPASGILRQQKVLEAMKRLPEDQREVVFLTFYEGLAYKEIARMLEIPEGTVKSRMFHAKRKLAEVLT